MRTLLTLIILLSAATTALADGWRPRIVANPEGPTSLLAIDKGDQRLLLLERKSPLKVVSELPCTTGQVLGDKQVRGDLRTPEGVYFLGPRIKRNLNWELYGDLAYSLNYPNPVDRLKGKTGSGIWLHGRGKQLVPRDTAGCVALTVPDLKTLNGDSRYGMPVVIGEDIEWDAHESESEAPEMAELVREWARAWESRSEAFFELYDPKKFTKAEPGSFKGFRNHKESIFRSTPWIHVMVDGVKAMRGPDYWVTWFDQLYRSPVLTQTVGKRLYWQKNEQGEWTVVGREYIPASRDLVPDYLREKGSQAKDFVRRWADAWRSADAGRYAAMYDEDAVSGSHRGIERIVDYKKTLWEEKPPVKVALEKMDVDLHPSGLKVSFLQRYEDASGYSDVGMKTLVLSPAEKGWKIEREDWRRL